LREIDKVTKR
jgi:zinc finger CCCH domain-containing protein 13